MVLHFDHLVHFIKGMPQEAVQAMEGHGWKAVSGGRHEMWGTYNSLLYAGLSYIEFLAIEDAETAKQSSNPLIKLLLNDQQGFGQICLRTNDIEKWKVDLEQSGMRTGSIIQAQRKRENGDFLQWKMLFIEAQDQALPYPFFIEWNRNDEERLLEMKQLGIIPEKQAGRRIASIHFAVKDMEATAASWSNLFNAAAKETYFDSKLGGFCKSVTIGGTELVFTQPGGNVFISEQIAKKGERPFMVSFDGNNTSRPIDIFGCLYRL